MPAPSSSPSVLLEAVTEAGLPRHPLDTAEAISLLQALTAVPDPRQTRGRRYSLQSILLLAVGAVLAGARSYAAMAQWARCAEQAVAVCGPTPHATTFGRVVAALDPAALQQALTGWVLTRRAGRRRQSAGHGPAPSGQARTVLAVDGKTLRGARDEHGQQTKLLAVFDHADHLALSQVEVVGGDELAAFVPVLGTIADLRGVLVTADALHCQRAHAEYLHARGGHYLFTVKANQPTLRRALARLPWAQAPGQRERTAGHGRTESRSIKVLDLAGTPEAELFPHGARAIKVVRRRHRAGQSKPSVETVYAITSLGHRDADAGLLAAWIRSHWTIENCLHWVRDVTEGEDHSSVRTGHGPQVMAALRNTAINIIRLCGETNIAAAHRAFSYRPADVLAALTAA
ncbi:MAG TPA: ISAs1 family transposase [Gaiellales bacterium]|nr:ISAs1 family transposase [Gaiellales bacterium]